MLIYWLHYFTHDVGKKKSHNRTEEETVSGTWHYKYFCTELTYLVDKLILETF